MNDLKLYNGINNIDDDLIEEANCKKKPVIHHCYAIAASAAAIFIAAGATGIFHNSSTSRKPAPSGEVVVSENTTSASSSMPETTALTSAQSEITATHCPETSTKPSVSDSKTSSILTNSHTSTTAVYVITSQTEVVSRETATEAVNSNSSDFQNYDYESEGSIIMKKYASLLSSLLVLTNVTGTQAAAQQPTFMPENEDIQLAERVKAYIEDTNIDIDFNCDGKFDVFDVYAFYRTEYSQNRDVIVGTSVATIPDYIMEKYNAAKKDYTITETYIDSQTNEEETYQYNYTLCTYDLMSYFFTYASDYCPEYFEPDYYIDNCPDDYQDDFPYEFIRHGDSPVSMWDFQKTMFVEMKSDGSCRFFNEDDAQGVMKFWPGYFDYKVMRHLPDIKVSPIHEFIEKLRYTAHDSGMDYPFIKEFIEKGYADPDIDSDGDFDMDDIIKLATFERRHSNAEENSFIEYLFYPETDIYHLYFDNEHYRHILSEDEWKKCYNFVDTAANYFNFYTREIIRYLTEYYLTYNEVDTKYFDPTYYEENNIAHFRAYSAPDGLFFGYLGYYETFSLKYGPRSSEYEEMTEEMKKRYNFTEDEINAAFPGYYKNVKTGVLPKPDIDLDGKITVADYNILCNLNYETASPYGYDYVSTMIRRYPELKVEIGIPQEVRDNFNTNFDFNHNGISCDSLEIECMLMYILNDLEIQYPDDGKYEYNKALYDAIDNYYVEHPELQYLEIFVKNLEKFNKNRDYKFTLPEGPDAPPNVTESAEILKKYSSFANIKSLPTGNGDANADGNVDLSDAVLIMQSLANPSKYGVNGSDEKHITDEGYILADVDGEGVTNMDALTIQKYLLGLINID